MSHTPRLVALALALVGPALLASPAGAADTYDVARAGAKATVGEPASTSVTITGKNGWHVNEEAPITLKLAPAAGVSVEKPKLTRADLAESTKDRARFDVRFTANEAGPKTIDAEASFVMCQATACQPVKEKVTLALDVAAPAAAPAKAAGKPAKPVKPAKKPAR